MKITPENIRKILDAISPSGLSVNELLQALSQKKSQKAAIRKSLRKLAQRGDCKKENNRYFLVSTKSTSQSGIPEQKGKKRGGAQRSSPLGIYLYANGTGVVEEVSTKRRHPVAFEDTLILFHGDEVRFIPPKKDRDKKPVQILEIVHRKTRVLQGRLHFKKRRLLFKSSSHHYPQEFLVKNQLGGRKIPEEEVQLEITRYPGVKGSPEGRVLLQRSKKLDEKEILSNILEECSITPKFPNRLLNACEHFPKAVRAKKGDGRVDLREYPIVTIDGDDARDFDDAIYAEKEGTGYRIWVSIADVDEYVTKGSVIDQEAFRRGTSVYFPGKVYPMLPEVLSNGLCSLREGVNRKTLTCEILLDGDGTPKETKIYESLIKTAARLTYNQVDHFMKTGELQVKPSQQFLKEHLALYREIAKVLTERRAKRGYINFSLPDTTFKYDEEWNVTDIQKTYQSEAMGLIEQFMLEANENVGLFCEQNNISIIWRNHASPAQEKIRNLKHLFWTCNLKIPSLHNSSDFNKALKSIRKYPEKDLLEYSLLRTMARAEYGVIREGHFGLAATHYCHFTSPIRRYPDLLVHRALKLYLKENKREEIPAWVGEKTSDREQLAVKAERKAIKLKKMQFITNKIGEIYTVKVSGMHWKGIYTEIDHPFVEGFVPFKSFNDDRYDYDEENQCVYGKRTKRKIRVGTPIRIMVSRIDVANFCPEFEWVGWED